MAERNNQSGKRMWPFSDMSLETASSWFDIANIVLLLSLLFGVLSTFAIIRLGNVKEHHWDISRQQSNERIKTLDSSIADATARTKEAELKLAQLRKLSGPRDIDAEAFRSAIAGKPKAPVTIWYASEASDGFWFATRLVSALTISGWELTGFPTAIPSLPGHPLRRFELPQTMVAGGQAMGVTIVGDAMSAGDDSNMKEGTPFAALMGALAHSVERDIGIRGASGSVDSPVPKGTLRIVIAPKADPIFNDAAPAASAK